MSLHATIYASVDDPVCFGPEDIRGRPLVPRRMPRKWRLPSGRSPGQLAQQIADLMAARALIVPGTLDVRVTPRGPDDTDACLLTLRQVDAALVRSIFVGGPPTPSSAPQAVDLHATVAVTPYLFDVSEYESGMGQFRPVRTFACVQVGALQLDRVTCSGKLFLAHPFVRDLRRLLGHPIGWDLGAPLHAAPRASSDS